MKKLLFLSVLFLLSCTKETINQTTVVNDSKAFVKEFYSYWDSEEVVISGDEIKAVIDPASTAPLTDLVVAVYRFDVINQEWVYCLNYETLGTSIFINESNGDLTVKMNGAPIDPAIKVKVVVTK
jgi:hypothetical protein